MPREEAEYLLDMDIPWRDIIAMRNRLVHAYFEINLDDARHRVETTPLPYLPSVATAASPIR